MIGSTNGISALATTATTKQFKILTATNSASLDEIPSTNADWVVGIYDTSWASRPSSWGLCFRMTAPTQQWSWEIALSTDATPGLYVRTSTNGNAWSAWSTK